MNVKISILCKKNAMKMMKLRDAAHLQYFPQLSISCQLSSPNVEPERQHLLRVMDNPL